MTVTATSFSVEGSPVVGVLHRPGQAPHLGVVVVTAGGPQYRIGGHRQLVLWSRRLADAGHAVLRFDYRGTGDSGGVFKDYKAIDDDIRGAIDHLVRSCPTVREVVLWGECNAASAILYYAHLDARVTGAVLLNPWVHTDAGAAKATLKRYYLQRLMQPSFWRKVAQGRFNPVASLRSAAHLLKLVVAGSRPGPAGGKSTSAPAQIPRELPLTEGLLIGLQRFSGRLLVVLSGRDPVAHEYEELLRGSAAWREALAACQTRQETLPMGDHTFSSAAQRDQVAAWALDWLARWPQKAVR